MTPQIPAPPDPGGHLSVGGSLGDAAAVVIVLAILGTALVIVWPLIRALARRLEGGGSASAELQAEVEALRGRVHQLEESQLRVAELEERLDFAERVLGQARESDRLQR